MPMNQGGQGRVRARGKERAKDKGHIRLSADNDIQVSPLSPFGYMSQNKGIRIKSPTISIMGSGDAGKQDSVKGCEIWPHGVDGDGAGRDNIARCQFFAMDDNWVSVAGSKS